MKFSLIENKYILFPPDRQNDCFMSYGINCFKCKVGRRSLEGCSPWGRWGLDATELLHFQFSLSCTGEGNGNPLQCSCLENPRDRGAWWAAVYGVAQSWTQLKRHSSSSSRFDSWVRKIPWRRKWQPTSVFLPGKSRGQRSLADDSPWDHKSQTQLSN